MRSEPRGFILKGRVAVDRTVARGDHPREESPDSRGRVLGNPQAERSDTGATENRPPMAERGYMTTGGITLIRLRQG